jgi:hypothetical protein
VTLLQQLLLVFDVILAAGTKYSVGGVAIGIFRIANRAIKNACDIVIGSWQIPAAQPTGPQITFDCSSAERTFFHMYIFGIRDGNRISMAGLYSKEKEPGSGVVIHPAAVIPAPDKDIEALRSKLRRIFDS